MSFFHWNVFDSIFPLCRWSLIYDNVSIFFCLYNICPTNLCCMKRKKINYTLGWKLLYMKPTTIWYFFLYFFTILQSYVELDYLSNWNSSGRAWSFRTSLSSDSTDINSLSYTSWKKSMMWREVYKLFTSPGEAYFRDCECATEAA